MPAGIATAESEARIERVKQEEIQRLIAANVDLAQALQAKKHEERERHRLYCQEWNKHYLECVRMARLRLGLNDQEPIDSREIAKEMERFRP